MRLIDPTCGSGHFLLGAFRRLFDVWARHEPARNLRDLTQQALNGVYGVDVNPFAVAIARFRLLLAALVACNETRLKDAPAFTINLAVGDSLLHGWRFDQFHLGREVENLARGGLAHVYQIEDLEDINRILGQQYPVVVGNPPYITVRDSALNAAYRSRYATCHMKYSLAVPFTERFFELALPPHDGGSSAPEPRPSLRLEGGGLGRGLGAGYVGMITANSFMKREFGSKLIEQFLPQVDLTHVIDTSGAYIPGHGTPTVILFGRDRQSVGGTVRTVMGIKGEPAAPGNPTQGLVWRAIVTQLDRVGSESAYVSVTDTPRATFAKHPWSIGGGGAADLKEIIEAAGSSKVSAHVGGMGFFEISAADDVILADMQSFCRRRVESERCRPLISGDEVRDWQTQPGLVAIFPYSKEELVDVRGFRGTYQWLWPFRAMLGARVTFAGRTYVEEGRAWWEWHQIALERIRTPLTITFAEVATHNHFVLDRGGGVFNRTAPVIKLSGRAKLTPERV